MTTTPKKKKTTRTIVPSKKVTGVHAGRKAKGANPVYQNREDRALEIVLAGGVAKDVERQLHMSSGGVKHLLSRIAARRAEMAQKRIDAVQMQLMSLTRRAVNAYAETLGLDVADFARERLTAADSILDRAGIGLERKQRVEATVDTDVTMLQVPIEFVTRPPADLEFYAASGYWPEEQKKKP